MDGLFDGKSGGELWYPGRITKVHPNGTYDIAYDDGDVETEVPAEFIHHVPDTDEESADKADANEANAVAVDPAASPSPDDDAPQQTETEYAKDTKETDL